MQLKQMAKCLNHIKIIVFNADDVLNNLSDVQVEIQAKE